MLLILAYLDGNVMGSMTERSFILSKDRDCTELSNVTARALNRLLQQLTEGKTYPELTLKRVNRILDDGASIACVAFFEGSEDTDDVVAMATLCKNPKPSGLSGEIHDVVVDSDHRRMGYGKQVIDLLIDEARLLGMKYVSLTCSRPEGQVFYEHLGFVKRETNRYRFMLT